MTSKNLSSYFRGQQVSVQWLQILQAMALELSETADPSDLRQLFVKIGTRFSKDVDELFQDSKTLVELEASLDDFWSRINWGWVELSETKGGIDIRHYAAPLAEAFGDEFSVWTGGLLEGFYQNVFSVLDPSHSMSVIALNDLPDATEFHFRYGRHAI